MTQLVGAGRLSWANCYSENICLNVDGAYSAISNTSFIGLQLAWSQGFELLQISHPPHSLFSCPNDSKASAEGLEWITDIPWIPRTSYEPSNFLPKLVDPMIAMFETPPPKSLLVILDIDRHGTGNGIAN
ncbi:hypothetical protein V6N12_073653 [Hibiscus sabdariffa]|uniref:RNase H type-1 domain-containing protein n=1 Tax=Hibiscus sabdariffa TaxID=183260 RepID=A0ABR2AN93_9ROSI